MLINTGVVFTSNLWEKGGKGKLKQIEGNIILMYYKMTKKSPKVVNPLLLQDEHP